MPAESSDSAVSSSATARSAGAKMRKWQTLGGRPAPSGMEGRSTGSSPSGSVRLYMQAPSGSRAGRGFGDVSFRPAAADDVTLREVRVRGVRDSVRSPAVTPSARPAKRAAVAGDWAGGGVATTDDSSNSSVSSGEGKGGA